MLSQQSHLQQPPCSVCFGTALQHHYEILIMVSINILKGFPNIADSKALISILSDIRLDYVTLDVR